MLRAVIDRAEAQFIAQGGIRERMTATRLRNRNHPKGKPQKRRRRNGIAAQKARSRVSYGRTAMQS